MSYYYDLEPILKKHRPINIILGVRGNGKTYALKRKCLFDFFNKGKEFVWIRNSVKAQQKTGMKWLKDIDLIGKELGLDDKGILLKSSGQRCWYVENRKEVIVGYFISISQQQNFKSTPFPKVGNIVYDEFLRFGWYGKTEVDQFRELLSTIQRDRLDVSLFMISNNSSMDNPYFDKLGIKYTKTGIRVTKNYAIQICSYHSIEQAEKYKRTLAFTFGKPDDDYNKYSMQGMFLMDNNDFVLAYKGKKSFKFNVEADDTLIGVWYTSNNLIYFSKQHNKNAKTYTLFKKDLQGNYVLGHHEIGRDWVHKLYKNSLIFESIAVKNNILEYLKQHV